MDSGMRERFAELREIRNRTVMIAGDIRARRRRVADFMAEATSSQ